MATALSGQDCAKVNESKMDKEEKKNHEAAESAFQEVVEWRRPRKVQLVVR